MRIISELPDKKHFRAIGHSERWPYIWEAICTPRLRLCVPVANPWNQPEWSIRIKETKGKSDKTQYTNRIDLQLFEGTVNDNSYPAYIVWEVDKGIAHSNQPTLRFYVIPFMSSQGQSVNLMVSIVAK